MTGNLTDVNFSNRIENSLRIICNLNGILPADVKMTVKIVSSTAESDYQGSYQVYSAGADISQATPKTVGTTSNGVIQARTSEIVVIRNLKIGSTVKIVPVCPSGYQIDSNPNSATISPGNTAVITWAISLYSVSGGSATESISGNTGSGSKAADNQWNVTRNFELIDSADKTVINHKQPVSGKTDIGAAESTNLGSGIITNGNTPKNDQQTDGVNSSFNDNYNDNNNNNKDNHNLMPGLIVFTACVLAAAIGTIIIVKKRETDGEE
ncbi:MAG: hypothetical protein GX478_08485 [Erysipelotrichaceae bacterium]|nr:hypothetical protein [Erysipelotrichaceae bacterium]